MEKLDILIDRIEAEIKSCNNPSTYENNEYYLKCKMTVSILNDVLQDLKEIKEDLNEKV